MIHVDLSNYVRLATRTEADNFGDISARIRLDGIRGPKMLRLLHGAMGLCTEAGEFQDMLKKHIFYGKDLDEVNLAEEIGDLLWYIAILSDTLDIPIQNIMQKNIEKLAARYGGKFSEEAAIHRDLDNERSVLEHEDNDE